MKEWENNYYIGQWLNGKKHGKGYIHNSKENNLIEVFYNNDKRQEKEGKSHDSPSQRLMDIKDCCSN